MSDIDMCTFNDLTDRNITRDELRKGAGHLI